MFWPIFIVYLNIQWVAAYLSFLMYASVLLGYSLIVLTTVVLYLLACDPLPPCPDRVAAWLRTLIPVRLAGSESPAGD